VLVLRDVATGGNEIIFSGLFSAIFKKNWWPYSYQFFPAINNFSRPVLCYLAGKTAIWQQCLAPLTSFLVPDRGGAICAEGRDGQC
jgi:hypothetical protein